MSHSAFLLGHEGQFLNLVCPFLSHQDTVLRNLIVLDGASLVIGIFDKRVNFCRVQCVEHVEEVLPIHGPRFRQRIREIQPHAWKRQCLLVHVLYAYLAERRHIGEAHLLHLQQRLVAFQHGLEMVLGDLVDWR